MQGYLLPYLRKPTNSRRLAQLLNRRRNPNVAPIMDAAASPYLQAGLNLFNAAEHWHAHEEWEHLWLGLEGDEKLFLQGLIMAAAMLVQYEKKIQRGVENHFQNVRARVAGLAYWGIRGDELLEQLRPFLTVPDLEAGTVQILRN
jgi:hypothetical protein